MTSLVNHAHRTIGTYLGRYAPINTSFIPNYLSMDHMSQLFRGRGVRNLTLYYAYKNLYTHKMLYPGFEFVLEST